MKKSNIILISIFGIFIVFTIVITVHLKHALQNIEDTSIGLSYENFNTLDIGTGWYINLTQGEETKVSVLEDSIKNLISLNGNTLRFKDTKSDNGRIKVEITNISINQINIKGYSFLRYRTDYIDSIFITQTGDSKVVIQNTINDVDVKSEADEKPGLINFVSVMLSNKSNLKIYNDINNVTGELRDSSKCRFTEQVFFTNFSKSKTSHIQSW